MKKSIVTGGLALIFSIYGLYAFATIQGVNIYLVTYNIGKVFMGSYWIAGVLAIAGWCGFGICLKKEIAAMKVKKTEKKEAVEEVTEIKAVPESEEATEIEEAVPESEEATEIEEAVPIEKKICKNCGAELKEAQKFCMKCGTKAE